MTIPYHEQANKRDDFEERENSETREELSGMHNDPTMHDSLQWTRHQDGIPSPNFARRGVSTFTGRLVPSSKRDMKTKLRQNLQIIDNALEIVNSPDIDFFLGNTFHFRGTPQAWNQSMQ